MHRLRITTLLISINVGLLLLAVTGVAVVAVQLLQQLADEQALARVVQAGTSARQSISRSEDEMLTDALLLAERPTLRQLLQANDTPSLTAYLEQFRQTGQLDGCVVLRGDRVIAQSGPALLWQTLWTARSQQEARFLRAQDGSDRLMIGAWASVPTLPDGAVMVVKVLDAPFVAQISSEIGLPVTVVGRQTALANIQEQHAALRRQALDGTAAAATRLASPAAYVATLPLRSPAGAVVGLVEAELSAESITSSLRQFVRTLLLLALGMAGVAALISLGVGRRFGRPLHRLTTAAARIGNGDLATPVPQAASAEIGTLAATLEEMRRHLLQLTADLRRQQSEAHAIVTGIVEGVFTVDRERRIRYLNPQAAALLDIGPEAAIGRFCGDVLNPQGPGGVRPCIEDCPIIHARFRSGARATEHLLLNNGQRRTIMLTSAPSAEEQQVQLIRDETELEATRRLRDAVLANISHEFKTPLSAQLASIELLLDQLADLPTEQIGQLVLALQRGTLRLTQLIDNLLESVRIEAGQHSIRHYPVALDEAVEEALDLTRPLMDQRGQTVLFELPYPLPMIAGDAGRLTQVFVNLLANANKFAPAGSTIRIGGVVGSSFVTLWVEDQGPGLPPMAGQSLFGRFIRAQAEEPEQNGMGLGLWIVKSIVERHGGRVDAQSDESGTRMSVILPVGAQQ
jgi:signal transduction histidine kinase/HAMP domain-containing protein